jgi:hypothetical protein
MQCWVRTAQFLDDKQVALSHVHVAGTCSRKPYCRAAFETAITGHIFYDQIHCTELLVRSFVCLLATQKRTRTTARHKTTRTTLPFSPSITQHSHLSSRRCGAHGEAPQLSVSQPVCAHVVAAARDQRVGLVRREAHRPNVVVTDLPHNHLRLQVSGWVGTWM